MHVVFLKIDTFELVTARCRVLTDMSFLLGCSEALKAQSPFTSERRFIDFSTVKAETKKN